VRGQFVVGDLFELAYHRGIEMLIRFMYALPSQKSG